MRSALLALFLGTTTACGDAPLPTDGQVEGSLLALSLVEQVATSLQLSAPYRCARLRPDVQAPVVPGMNVSVVNSVLSFEEYAKNKPLVIATVADARGSDAETLRAVASIREKFVKQGVNLVVSLGGMGQSKESIQAVLGELSRDAPYLLIALPGDRESVAAHRQAVAALDEAGVRVLDGAAYRLLRLGNLLVATMPGITMTANLVAGNEGCEHTGDDVDALLKQLSDQEGQTVLLASYAPLREEGAGASDWGGGGIHTGERLLSRLLGAPALRLVIHGMVEERLPAPRGKIGRGQGATSLATGSLDPLDGPSAALLLSVAGQKLSWRRVHAEP